MEALIDSYGLDSSKFFDLLKENKAVISGSSVLSIYLEHMFVPNDIDIWIPLNTINSIRGFTEKFNEISLPFYKFLWKAGFEEKELTKNSSEINSSEKIRTKDEENNYQNISLGGNKIFKVFDFCHESSGKKVQLVFIKNINPINFIKEYFDISVCKTWFNPETKMIETDDKENTSKKQMYISYDIDYEKLHQKNKDRIEKYKARGFTLIDNPKKIFNTFTKEFDIIVEDIIAFDSYNLVEFLKEKEYNIVIKSGENYQAWNRSMYISQCKIICGKINDIHKIGFYESPLLQIIKAEQIFNLIFRSKNYKIFEIVKTEDFLVKCSDKQKSIIHDIIPMSIKDFEKKYTSDGRKID